ncbi:unnamed protein product [Musa hybrid cultivar]
MPCVLISFFMTGYGDILPIFGSSCNTSSAGIVAKDKKYRQLDCSICFLLGAYRAFDILNWIYRYFTEPHCVHWIIGRTMSSSSYQHDLVLFQGQPTVVKISKPYLWNAKLCSIQVCLFYFFEFNCAGVRYKIRYLF